MASIIEGFEYDIFISYRQKDNKGDRWVSEFVEALKTELESTFKEEISVYFDINPHDGLLETHDVDASLKEKLRCLVFIPIISRTYCDPKSFAWEHEFKTFVEHASQDQFGLKVKLPNGNVANRVLPVRIHDLDNDDIKLCESILAGALRGVEFIYKSAGVNRPLRSKEDSPDYNLNKTFYRDQINKVALAIKEIILGLKTDQVILVKEGAKNRAPLKEVNKEEKKAGMEKPAKLNKRKLLAGAAILTALIIAALLAYPRIFKRDTLERLRSSGERISVAVMPFQNMTNDATWNEWQDGIKDELINYLTNYYEELEVRQTESINGLLQSKNLTNYASITPAVASTISKKMDARVVVFGSIKKSVATIRINAQLIDSKTEEALKSFQIDGTAENILHMTDSLSMMIKNFLLISKLGMEVPPEIQQLGSTNSPEAYRYYIDGSKAFMRLDYIIARDMLSKAIVKDSNFFAATLMLSLAYGNPGIYKEAKKWCLKVYEKRDQLPKKLQISVNAIYAKFFGTPYEIIKCWKQLLEYDDQMPTLHYNIGGDYNSLYQYDNAIPEFEKALEIWKKWGSKPIWVPAYTNLGFAYHKTGQYKKEKKLYKKAEQDYPDNSSIIYRQAILALTEGDTIVANKYIEKYRFIRKDNADQEANIMTGLATLYSEAGILKKAEEYYQQALSFEPESPSRLNNLAYFLIDKDRNINQGLELVDKALELNPDNYLYLDTKGWGLYKKNKYKEALELLDKSDSLKPIYSHALYLHRQEVKKAIAGQKK